MRMAARSTRVRRLLNRTYTSFVRDQKPPSNNSFLLGAAVGASVGVATALYLTHSILPKDLSLDPVFGNVKAVKNAINELRTVFPGDRSTVDEAELIRHGSSAWFPMHNEGSPNIVVYPHTTTEVQQIARIATRYRVPIIPYGAGTSIEGQFSPGHGGICVDFSEMDKILEIQLDDMTVTLQPGVSWQTLNTVLDERETGLFFPVDPCPLACMGGMVGTSCSGPNAARYGTMREWVLSCTVVTADGQVFRTRSKAKKSSTGYALNQLLVGAEGTLGLVTEVTLRLTNKPTHEVVGICAFPDVASVTRVVMAAKREGIDAQCLELLDADNMPAINDYAQKNYPHLPHLFFKLSGANKRVVADHREALARLCRDPQHAGVDFTVSTSAAEAADIWSARKNLLLASLARHGGEGTSALSTDVCVPMSKLPDLVTRYKMMSKERGLASSVLGHVADGNFHSLILYRDGSGVRDSDSDHEDSHDHRRQKQAAQALARDLCKLSLELGGTVSGEHGVGSAKREFMLEEYGVLGIDLMMRIKEAWDPHGLLNPGKLLPPRSDLIKAKLEARKFEID